MEKFDCIVIGSGPGGYVAAIRAAQLGMNTAIIEKYDALGGTCLNVGCIPSKAMLDSSEHLHRAKSEFEEHGIGMKEITVDLKQMVKRKSEVVSDTVNGINFLMKKNKISVFQGIGSFVDEYTIEIKGKENIKISGKNIIIATGSKPSTPEIFHYDKKRVITSTEALEITSLPDKMIIVGGGVIGLELGTVFTRLGTAVEVVEFQDEIISMMDKDSSKELRKILKKLGITFHLGHKVTKVTPQKSQVKVEVEPVSGDGRTFELKADYCLLSIGRKPYTEGLGLDNVDIEVDEEGCIIVNDHLQTKYPHIYAIGDVIKGAMLAHKASEEGILVAEYIGGQKPHIDYNLIPSVVYTWPEVASVGKTEEELNNENIEYKVGKFPFKAIGRARASNDTDGFVKIIADRNTDEVLGVHIVGARAADLIAEAVIAMEYRASAEDIAISSHAHPTFAEAMKEAALAATGGRAIHI